MLNTNPGWMEVEYLRLVARLRQPARRKAVWAAMFFLL